MYRYRGRMATGHLWPPGGGRRGPLYRAWDTGPHCLPRTSSACAPLLFLYHRAPLASERATRRTVLGTGGTRLADGSADMNCCFLVARFCGCLSRSWDRRRRGRCLCRLLGSVWTADGTAHLGNRAASPSTLPPTHLAKPGHAHTPPSHGGIDILCIPNIANVHRWTDMGACRRRHSRFVDWTPACAISPYLAVPLLYHVCVVTYR